MKCSICSGEFDLDGEGGIAGDFGILPVAFCPTCLSGVEDMCKQLGNFSDEQEYNGEMKKETTNNFFWNDDDWFLFARDYLRFHISCDDSVLEAVRKSVDMFEKPHHWEPEYRDWQHQRLNNHPKGSKDAEEKI